MDNFLVKIYLGQVREECEFCFHSINLMNAILKKEVDSDFFQPALDLIQHAAAVSRIFWPPSGKDRCRTKRARIRGCFLRNLINIQEGHIVKNRELRDHFSHFDERLDDWAETSKNRNIVFRLIGPRNAIGGDSIQDTDIIYHFDPSTNIFGFRGEHFNIQALADGLDDIYKKTISKLKELETNK